MPSASPASSGTANRDSNAAGPRQSSVKNGSPSQKVSAGSVRNGRP